MCHGTQLAIDTNHDMLTASPRLQALLCVCDQFAPTTDAPKEGQPQAAEVALHRGKHEPARWPVRDT